MRSFGSVALLDSAGNFFMVLWQRLAKFRAAGFWCRCFKHAGPCFNFLLRQPVGRNQKFRQKPETTEVDERIIGEIVEKSVEIIDTVFQNRDPTGIQPIGAVQIVYGATSDDGIQRH